MDVENFFQSNFISALFSNVIFFIHEFFPKFNNNIIEEFPF